MRRDGWSGNSRPARPVTRSRARRRSRCWGRSRASTYSSGTRGTPERWECRAPARRTRGWPGPLAAPGRYEARLTVGGDASTQSFELLGDPRSGATIGDLEAQRNLLLDVRDRRTELSRAVHQARVIREQAREWRERASSDERFQAVVEAANVVVKALDGIEESLVQLEADGQLGGISHEARLDAKLAELTVVVSSGDHPPTSQAYAVFEEVSGRLDEVLARLEQVRNEDVGKLSALIGELGVPAIGGMTRG